MKYTKPPLSVPKQADLLISRGMVGDRDLMIARLSSVSYYRLTGYWFPFRMAEDQFRAGTSFDEVWRRYVFDRRLRLLVMDAIERIEIAVRTQLSLHHSHEHGPFGYATDPASLPELKGTRHSEFLQRVHEEIDRSKEYFVKHFRTKYGDHHDDIPIWMAAEVLSLGTVLTFYRGTSGHMQQQVAASFGMPGVVFDSWLLTLNTVRNICAHHSRLWNRELGTKPKIPRQKNYPDWYIPAAMDNGRMFAVLTICRYCLQRIAPQSHWPERLRSLLSA
jgi:abortive infection bacteriophage resistance protein